MTSTTNQFGISIYPSENELIQTVRSLEVENDAVLALYNKTFPLHDIIMQPDGNKLRAAVRTVMLLVQTEIAEYRALFQKKQLPRDRQGLSDDLLASVERVFLHLTQAAPNDNIARTAQLGIFFSALVLENAFFAHFLPDTEQAIRVFAPDGSLVQQQQQQGGSDRDTDIISPQFLKRRALTAFATKYLSRHFSKLVDGTNEITESIETFVTLCVCDYLAQLPGYLPRKLAPTPTIFSPPPQQQ